MYYEKASANSSLAIVFVHGNSSSSTVFSNILQNDSVNFTKITVDLSGHGKAKNEILPENNLMGLYKEQLTQFINELNEDVLLVGNSIGGHLAIEIASNINNLKGLVIMGTPPVEKPINFAEAFLPVEALNTFLTENPTTENISEACTLAVYKNGSEQLMADFNHTNPKVRALIGGDLLNGHLENERLLFSQLTVPKFIIRGKNDPSVNPDYLDAIAAENNNCTLFDIEKCGHFPSIEQPEIFNNLINKIANEII